MQALSVADTPQAETALHQAVPALHLVDKLTDHQDLVQSMAISQDGTRLASASQDGLIIVWDLDSWLPLVTFEHAGAGAPLEEKPPLAVAFSPDGNRLATGGVDRMVRIWELIPDTNKEKLNPELRFTLAEHSGVINAIAYSPDGKHLATASSDGIIIIWDNETGERIHTLSGHSFERLDVSGIAIRDSALFRHSISRSMKMKRIFGVTDITFSPRGGQLISGGVSGRVMVWDVSSGDFLYEFGRLIMSDQPSSWVQSCESQEGEFKTIIESCYIGKAHDGPILDLAINPEGSLMATASEDGTVKIWGFLGGYAAWVSGIEPVHTINEDSISLAFSPDGTHLATGAPDGEVHVWDARDGRQLVSLVGHTSYIHDLTFTPEGYLITGSEDTTIRIWDPKPAGELFTLTSPQPVQELAISPNGKYITAGLEEQTILVWERASGQLLYPPIFSGNLPVYALAFNPDGTLLATSNMDILDTETGERLCQLVGHTDRVTANAFRPQGTYLATASYDQTVKVWDLRDCETLLTPIANLIGHEDRVEGITFSPDGRQIASVGRDRIVRIWDLSSGTEELNWSSDNTITGVAFNYDGTHLAVSDQEGTINLWDITSATPQITHSLSGHTGAVFDIDISPDGKFIASAGSDGAGKVWDLATGEEFYTLYGHLGVATSVEFGPDGTWLVSSGKDGVVRGYTLQIEELKDIAKARLTRSLTTEECQRYLHLETCPDTP